MICRRQWDRMAPVSYTHLDVYKRQNHNKSAQSHANGIAGNAASATKLKTARRINVIGDCLTGKACLLYTSCIIFSGYSSRTLT